MALIYGAAVLILIWWATKLFAKANPASLARLVKSGGGMLALGVAGLLMLRGRLDMAVFVGGIGAWLLGWSAYGPGGMRLPWGDKAAGLSQASSLLLEIEVAPGGAIDGRVKDGPFAGRRLSTLSASETAALMRDCSLRDPQGVRLLQAYLDRRPAGGGEDAQGDADSRQSRPARAGTMSHQEAYEILGLQPGAGEHAIREAHRALMKRIHPDAGGTSGLAARVNQAKDVLVK